MASRYGDYLDTCFCCFCFFGSTDDYFKEKENMEQREKLGLATAPKGRSASPTPPSEPTNALHKVEVRACG